MGKLFNFKNILFVGLVCFSSYANANGEKVPCERSLRNLADNIEGPRLTAEAVLKKCKIGAELPPLPPEFGKTKSVCSKIETIREFVFAGSKSALDGLRLLEYYNNKLQGAMPQFDDDVRTIASVSECPNQYISGSLSVKNSLERTVKFCRDSEVALGKRYHKFTSLMGDLATLEFTICKK